jgi:hypothetical protein
MVEEQSAMSTGDHYHEKPMVDWLRYWQVMAAKATETRPWWAVMAAKVRQMMTHKNRNAA